MVIVPVLCKEYSQGYNKLSLVYFITHILAFLHDIDPGEPERTIICLSLAGELNLLPLK